VYVGLALVAHPLTVLLFGMKWAPSVHVMQALTLAGLVQCQTIFTGQYVVSMGQYSSELRWTVTLVCAELIGFAATVQFGTVAVALSLGAVVLIGWPIRLGRVRRLGAISLRAYFRPYPVLLAATAGMAAGVFAIGRVLLHAGAVPLLAAQVGTGIVLYVTLLAALAPNEIAVLRGALRQIRT
jgi:O-antigen/teichoic acid export membrane protein